MVLPKWILLLVCWIVILRPAHADTIFDFTVANLIGPVNYDDPSSFTYRKVSFTLPQGAAPDFVGGDFDQNGDLAVFDQSDYDNVPMLFATEKNGMILSQSFGVGSVRFWWDGIQLYPDNPDYGLHVYDVGPPFPSLTAFHPDFQEGIYNDPTEPGNYYAVKAETPEPEGIVLLATGVIGGIAVLRRRLISS